jgi:16S rRNA G966 N2-methylase RsmD
MEDVVEPEVETDIREVTRGGIFPPSPIVDHKKLQVSRKNTKCVTPSKFSEKCAMEIEKTMGTTKLTIIESCGGNGGDTITFAQKFDRVIAVEKDYNEFRILQNNVLEYKLKNVLLLTGSFLDFPNLTGDVLYIDPPWGEQYKKFKRMHLYLDYHNIIDLIDMSQIPLIVVKVPYNYRFFDLRQYLETRHCSVWSCPVRNYFLVFVKKIKYWKNRPAPSATGPSATGPSATAPSATGPSATGPSATAPSATGPSVTTQPKLFK